MGAPRNREALTLDKPLILACVDGLFPPDDVPDDIQAVRGKEGIRFYAEFFEAGIQRTRQFYHQSGENPGQTND